MASALEDEDVEAAEDESDTAVGDGVGNGAFSAAVLEDARVAEEAFVSRLPTPAVTSFLSSSVNSFSSPVTAGFSVLLPGAGFFVASPSSVVPLLVSASSAPCWVVAPPDAVSVSSTPPAAVHLT